MLKPILTKSIVNVLKDKSELQDVTEEELDAIIESDQQNQIFAQSLMQNSRSGQAKAVLSEVQTRHDDIKRIQKTIMELAQLFEDMQMMVEDQGKTLDQVEEHAINTSGDIEQGVNHISKAIVLARSTRALLLFLSGGSLLIILVLETKTTTR
ncbi:hypothetical protein G6F56_002245 [Rhizopus delemar]|nr:hypothetical protein G6F56_002245 [Rhizopus delemar]